MYKYFGEPRPDEDNQYFVEIRVDKLLAASCCMQIRDKKQFLFLFLPIKEEGHVSWAKTCYAWDFMCLVESGWGPPMLQEITRKII